MKSINETQIISHDPFTIYLWLNTLHIKGSYAFYIYMSEHISKAYVRYSDALPSKGAIMDFKTKNPDSFGRYEINYIHKLEGNIYAIILKVADTEIPLLQTQKLILRNQ